MVKDYDLIAETINGEVTLVQERRNVMRFKQHTFETVEIKSFSLKIYQTWGAHSADVFDFRLKESFIVKENLGD